MAIMKKFIIAIVILALFAGGVFWFAGREGEQSAKKFVIETFARAGIEIGGKNPWDITVHNEAFYPEVVAKGSLGLGETYMAEMWDSPAVDQFIYRLLTAKVKEKWSFQKVWRFIQAKLFNLQNKSLSKRVIDVHYNLGNDLYEKMLGPTMAYSCGYWKDAKNLNEAQDAK